MTTTMTPQRRAALVSGIFYIATFVFSFPALAFYAGVVDDPNWVLGAGGDGGVLWGAFVEILTAVSCIGTAVAVYPVIKRFGPARAVGFIASRTVEALLILTGVLALLSVYTLRGHGGDAATLTVTASALVALKDWTFLLGPGLAPAVNAFCFATILRRHGLVPRIIPTIGLVGAPLLVVSSFTTMFGGWEQASAPAFAMALPIAAWEFAVGTYMIVRGFRIGEPAVAVADTERSVAASALVGA